MRRKSNNRDGLFQSENSASVDVSPRQGPGSRKSVSRMKRPKPAAALTTEMPYNADSVDAIMRTGLLMAALRLWELKNGFHDYF